MPEFANIHDLNNFKTIFCLRSAEHPKVYEPQRMEQFKGSVCHILRNKNEDILKSVRFWQFPSYVLLYEYASHF